MVKIKNPKRLSKVEKFISLYICARWQTPYDVEDWSMIRGMLHGFKLAQKPLSESVISDINMLMSLTYSHANDIR